MKKLLVVISLVIGCMSAHATTNCDMPTGSSESTISAAITAASTNACTVARPNVPNGSTVYLQAGSYSWTSNLSLPCGSTKWTLTGPSYIYPAFPSAVVTMTYAGNTFLSYPTCSTGFNINAIEWNGNHPSHGGGFLYAGQGSSNYTITYNYVHGMKGAAQSAPDVSQVFMFLDGQTLSSTSNPPVASNIAVQWNRIGATNGSDCEPYMEEYQYVPNNSSSGSAGSAGGYCGTFGVHTYTSNVSVTNNNWFHVEQAGKCYAGPGGAPYYAYLQTNFLWQYNDMSQEHRMGFEGQCQANPTELFDSNSIHDFYYPGYQMWGLSLPQSGGAPGIVPGGGQTNSMSNLIIGNVAVPSVPATSANCWVLDGGPPCWSGNSTGGYYYPPAIEFWGPGTAGHNLAQGPIGGFVAYGCESGRGTVSNNIAQLLGGSFVGGPEQCTPGQAPAPIQTNNAFGTVVSARASAPPSISPTPTGTYSAPIRVTITSNGYTGNTQGPVGNTSAYYTTDGSKPTTASTFCGYTCTFSVAQGSTVSAISMWGALNQPKSYQAGYGFIPSGSVTATYNYSGGGVIPPPIDPPPIDPPSSQILGTNLFSTAGSTYPNALNSTYAVTGAASTISSCSFYLPNGSTYTAGGKYDCGIILAPSPTTQATSWLCHATYTTLGTSADVGFHTLPIAGCGTLTANTGYWIAVNTNLPGPIGQGFYNCGGTCSGTAPSVGTGTSPCSWISASYGTYSGMGTAMNASCGGGGLQASNYVTLTAPTPAPKLTAGYLTTPGSISTLQTGTTSQFFAACGYNSGQYFLCSPNADAFGNQMISITSNNPAVLSVANVGTPFAGTATAGTAGFAIVTATLTGGIQTTSYGVTVTTSLAPLPLALNLAVFASGGRPASSLVR